MSKGRHAARNIPALQAGRTPEPFHYRDRGMMATVGRGAAIVGRSGGRLGDPWYAPCILAGREVLLCTSIARM